MKLRKQLKVILTLFNVLFSSSILIFNNFNSYDFSIDKFDPKLKEKNLKNSNTFQEEIIVFFNRSSYNNTVISRFEYYGGTIRKEWNNMFSSTSGFGGIIPTDANKTLFQNDFPGALIENDEILETQMNFASIQTGAFNSTWSLNGYKGNSNSSIAVLDTGINPNHDFFPNGFNPLDLNGNIVGWQNFIDDSSISDDNGHGTFVSSIISGTGTTPYNSNNPSTVKLYGNYSHLELFEEYSAPKNYTFKIFSFNVSKPNSQILINSSWNWNVGGIDGFWFELFYNDTLIKYSHNVNPNEYYIINHTLIQNEVGIYDLFIKYHKQFQSKPAFSFNTTVSYFPEFYVENYSYFTGIANATKIVAFKILNQSGKGYSSDLISALASVIQNRSKYHIISVCLSIGTLGEDVKAINAVINEVIENGILVVIAAGNSGIEVSDALNRLAKNKNAIVVGAINDKDQVTSYSSIGTTVKNIIKPDIVAPGGSTLPNHRTIVSAGLKSDEITSSYGTSISTAIVSAAINLLIEARWNGWDQWKNLNLTKWVKIIKAILLMTASETNLDREDDPSTLEDESDYSPTFSLAPLTTGIKDIHEGYGRINIQAAIDALTKKIDVNSSISDSLMSSRENPLGAHVFARQVSLTEDKQYLFNLSIANEDADFDMFLFSNESNQYGEPILLESSRKWYGDFNYFYFTPKKNQTNCIVAVKAIDGKSSFTLNLSTVENKLKPELEVREINYVGGSKNTTIMGLQEFTGNNPKKNYSIDSYRFYIEYHDNDTSNVPPQEVYVSILEISKNYTLYQFYPPDITYTDGALFVSNYIQFSKPGVYHYFFVASDGKFQARYPIIGTLNITIEFPTDSVQFPHHHSFNDGIGNWTYTGTGWDLLQQSNINDNRSRIYGNSWSALYFGTYHDYPINYTYQPIRITEDPFPNGSLTSPLFNLTQLNENKTQPFAKFGLRVSINAGDFIYLQINLNWTGWFTIRTYNDEEEEWFLEKINLTQYIGYFVQFRFETSLDDTFDPINYKGLILDYFSLENYTNKNSPLIIFDLTMDISSTQGSKYQKFVFSCEYYDLDNNFPHFVYLEMDDNNYTMYNIYGDWNASSNSVGDKGIFFTRALTLEAITNQSFRFHVSDGQNLNTTQWFNKNNSLVEFINPTPLEFNIFKDNKFIGYKFSNATLSDYYVTGTPTPKELTSWFGGDNSWHPVIRLGKYILYGGLGQSYGGLTQGYGVNWDMKLITRPLHLKGEYDIYLEFDYEISLQNEFFEPEDQLDKCIISISKDYGDTWKVIKEYTYDSETLFGREKFDISQYSGEDVMIMFTLHSNDNVIGLGYGWLLYNIYVGYDKSTDFIAPKIKLINPRNGTTVKSMIMIEANITDNVELDISRIYIYLNNKSVDRNKLQFDVNNSLLEFKWETTKYNDGTYELKIVAYDKEGNKAETSIVVKVNNMKWWRTWGPYIILFSVVVGVGIIIYIMFEKKGKFWIAKIRNVRVERIRLRDIDKDQVIKRIDLIEQEEELKRPLALYCKSCRSWFWAKATDFDIICPVCEHDQIWVAYKCSNCGKFYLKTEPRENYYCKNKGCKGVRLIRREKEEIQDFLSQEGKILRKFERKKKKFSILDK